MENDKKLEQKKRDQDEPTPGEGIRSLQTWQKLAAARKALASDQDAREKLASDPASYFRQFGVDGVVHSGTAGMSDLERQLGVAAPAPQMQLQTQVRRGCAAVVVVWAGAVAVNVAGAANAAAVANVAANANYAANANVTVNVNYAAGA